VHAEHANRAGIEFPKGRFTHRLNNNRTNG
jgi:hypothetical protein